LIWPLTKIYIVSGDYSLDIFPVQLEDDARYQCQVSPSPTGQPGRTQTNSVLE